MSMKNIPQMPRTGTDFRSMSDDDVRRFLHDSTATEAAELARTPYCPAFAYAELADYPDTQVRATLANRRGAEAKYISRKLGHDKEEDVLHAVAANPWSEPQILSILTRSSNHLIAQVAAANCSTPSDAVELYYQKLLTRR